MSTATLGGQRVAGARLNLPAWGLGWADASMVEEVTLEVGSRTTLVLGDLTWSCTVVAGGTSKGRAAYRLVGGAGGWGKVIAPKGYANDGGVKASTVLQDAAAAAGETLAGDVPTTRLGAAWARAEAPAGRVLELVAPRGWYVDEAGATRFGRRPAVPIAVEARIGPVDRARGRVTFSAEAIATLLPGVIVEGIEAVDVAHDLVAGAGITTTIVGQGQAPTDRALAALAVLLDQLRPFDRYRGITEFRVVTREGERLTLQPALASSGMPNLSRVRVRPGVPGVRADVTGGSMVLVAFVNADPGRPVVVGFDDAESGGFATARLDLSLEDETGVSVLDSARRVVRYGDPILFASPGPGLVELPAAGNLSPVRA